MSQSYPWFKFAHVEYLLNPAISSLSLEAQGANTRLMAYAARQPEFGTLPTNEKQLISMSGCKSAKQWHRILNELFSNGVWRTIGFAEDNNVRLFCPMMIVDSAPVSQETTQNNEAQEDISAKRSAAAKARWDAKRASDMQNANLHHANTMQNDANTNFAYANEGGKGGDLDLDLNKDLDLKQELNSHSKTREAEKNSRGFFDDELRPDLNLLNAKLGANLVTQKFIDENLFSFNSHYETHQLTDNQRLAKWITWWKGEQAKQQAQTIQRPSKKPTADKYNGFAERDYSVGINADGSF